MLKIITPTTIAVDFNKNNKIDNDEIIKTFDVVDLQSLTKDDINFFKKRNEFTDNDIKTIKTLSYDFSKQQLENKFVKTVKIFHLKNEYIILVDGMNYSDLLLNNNFAFHKYYFKRKTFKKKSVNKKDNKKVKEDKFKKIPKPDLYFSQNNVEIYISDYTDNLKPDYNCNKKIAKRLVNLINSSKKSIDITVYDMTPNSCIINSLKSAQKRGVKVRLVIDKKKNEEENTKLNKIFDGFENKTFDDGKDYAKLMHNKFIIIDNEILQAGSLNYSYTDLSEYNSNIVLIIKNKNIAELYKKEFEQMYEGQFHTQKISNEENRCFDVSSQINICGYFSPQDKIIETQIIPLVRSAKHSLYMPIFVITYKPLVNELITAKNRGVDVKLIADATSASNPYYNVKKLRDAGIQVKVESYAGKMHMKSVIVDESIIGIGSINFSNSGQNKNDENFMIIKSPYLAKNYTKYFMYLWQVIPDVWLKHNPRAESKYSKGSCNDGIDNNYDGNIDSADDGCK